MGRPCRPRDRRKTRPNETSRLCQVCCHLKGTNPGRAAMKRQPGWLGTKPIGAKRKGELVWPRLNQLSFWEPRAEVTPILGDLRYRT